MLEIERLRLQLPEGFRRRAPRIARLVAEQLAQCDVGEGGRIGRLRAGPVTVGSGDSDRQVATAVARAIDAALAAAPRDAGEP
jgi:hypothetical protein